MRDDYQHIRLTYITHFFLDGGSDDAVRNLLERYQGYDPDVISRIHFVLVDDCSATPVDLAGFRLNIELVTVTDNIQWNQAGARNVGVVYAKSDKILLTDIDHVFPEHTLRELVSRKNPVSKFYKFYRKRENGSIGKAHPNTFFMSRARFMRFYGYDEEFSGNYGGEDYRFVKNLKYHGSRQQYLSKKYWCSRRDDFDKKGDYHSLKRDHSSNTPVDKRKAEEIRKLGGEFGHSRQFLNFRWEISAISRVEVPEAIENRWWWRFWWFRTIMGSWK